MTWPRHDERASAMAARYAAGLSCSQVAAEFGVTRQSVHGLLRARGIALRTTKRGPSVEYRGQRYSPQTNGYWRATTGDRHLLHRRVWTDAHGPLPDGWDVHHRDRDVSNNALENLRALPRDEHTRLHAREDRCSA